MRSERTGLPPSKNAVARIRHFVLPLMIAAFGVYVVVHSPLRDMIAAALGLRSRACYFLCLEALKLHGVAESLSAWTLIVAAVLAAWIVSDRFEGPSYERPLVFGISALAFITVPAALVAGIASWSGTMLLRPPLGSLLSVLPAAIVLAVGLWRGWRPWLAPRIKIEENFLVLWVGIPAIIVVSISTFLSLLHPPTGYDALGFHAPMAVLLWRDGSLDAFLDRAPGAWNMAHPGTIHLWFGLLQYAGGERLSNLGQLPFALLGSAAVNAFTRYLGLGIGAGMLAAGAFLLIPIVVMQSGMQLVDVAGAALLMATIALGCAPAPGWTAGRVTLLGLGLGLTVTSKLALLPPVVGMVVFLIAGTFRCRHQWSNKRNGIYFVIAAVAFFSVIAPWWIRNIVHYGNPLFPANIPLVGGGILETEFGGKDAAFVPHALAWLVYPLIEKHSGQSGFGTLVAISIVPGFIFALARGRRRPMLLYTAVVIVTLPAWWVLTRHEPRFLLPLFGLSLAFLPWSLFALPRRHRPIGSFLIVGAAFFSAITTVNEAVVPFALEPHMRNEFYDIVWGVDPVVASLPENNGLLHNTGYAEYTYPGHYPLLGSSLRRIVVPVDTDASTEDIIATMRTTGLLYAYVAASPASRVIVEMKYDKTRFELVHSSMIQDGWMKGTHRYLYRLKDAVLSTSKTANS